MIKTAKSWFTIPNLHLLLGATCALMAGIFLGPNIPPFLSYPLLIFPIGIMGWWYRYIRPLFLAGITACCLLAGGALVNYKQGQFDAISQLLSSKKHTLQATITNIEAIQHKRFSYKITLQISQIKPEQTNSWTPCSCAIAIYAKTIPHADIQDTIEVTDIQCKEITQSSFRDYCIKEGIISTLFFTSFDPTIITRPTYSLSRWLFHYKKNIYTKLQEGINPETFHLVSSIFFGNNTSVKDHMAPAKEDFKTWGISHYLARSGLHVIIFIIIWQFLLSCIPLSFRTKHAIIALLILCYACLSWSSVSFMRALLMYGLYTFCIFRSIPSHYIHSIALAACVILLANPFHLFFLDFQLSFGFTFILAWFNSVEAEKNRASQ